MPDWLRRILGVSISLLLFAVAVACGLIAVAVAPWPSVMTVFELRWILSVPFALIAWGSWVLAVDCWPD